MAGKKHPLPVSRGPYEWDREWPLISNSSLNLVGYFKSWGKELCNLKDLLLTKEHEFFVVKT